MESKVWPNLNLPLGTFVLVMNGQFSHFKLTPFQIRSWEVAWQKKSKWYRSRINSAPTDTFDWAKEIGITVSKRDVYEMWIDRGDQVLGPTNKKAKR